jgi:hypothetical protein
MRMTFCVAIICTALTGCSTYVNVTSSQVLERKLTNEDAIITHRSGNTLRAQNICFHSDSIQFFDAESRSLRQISQSEVGNIRITHHGGGALEGMLWGLAGGGVICLGTLPDHGTGSGWFGVLALVAGGLGGSIYGGIVGHDYFFVFPSDSVGARDPILPSAPSLEHTTP